MSNFIKLSNWMTIQPKCVVAVHKDQCLSSEQFVLRVSAWRELLSAHQGSRWVVYHNDAFEFLAILYALWYLGRIACISGDNCQTTIDRLTKDADGFIGLFPDALSMGSSTVVATTHVELWQPLDANITAVEIYTSGSSGEPKAISKTLEQLERELLCLESQWPDSEGVVLSTVSHQHLYGLTFRLLWPFAAGQAFAQFTSEYTEDIFNLAQYYSGFALISSPSHLSRINPLLDWESIAHKCHYIFSSAAPLARKNSRTVSQMLRSQVREIYGSSETGVIAWREQINDETDANWYALPGVKLEVGENGQTSISSPFLGGSSPQHLGDNLKLFQDGGFELLCRSDNIVKVEGKRVSLTAVESVLASHEWIDQVKVLLLNGHRVELAVVTKLSKLGESKLMLLGRKALIQSLRAMLAKDFETIVIPRRWRFVDNMPYNQQGKLPLASLLTIVEQPPLLKWPALENVVKEDLVIKLSCKIPADLIYFDGHFDDHPILPGVVQVSWAESFARQFFTITSRFQKLEVIKFLHVIRPLEELCITLEFKVEKNQVNFSYLSDKGLHSSGRICFE